ncbi:MAG: cytidylate kinase-like family protein [Verrucomicrobiia bacterium]
MIVNANASAEHCLSFISSQLQGTSKPGVKVEKNVRRAVTISRQAGCGAVIVAEKLAHYLHHHSSGDTCPWTVFDRDLMSKVLEDHNLPARMARYLPEDRVSQIDDILADVLEVHPPTQEIIEQTAETILRLAGLGNVILVGRGATLITARVPHVLHVRLVAPLEKRVEHAHQFYSLTVNEAYKFCLNQDRARERYLKRYFSANINDPLLYHLVINTDLVGYDAAAKLIGDAVLNLN